MATSMLRIRKELDGRVDDGRRAVRGGPGWSVPVLVLPLLPFFSTFGPRDLAIGILTLLSLAPTAVRLALSERGPTESAPTPLDALVVGTFPTAAFLLLLTAVRLAECGFLHF